MCTCIPPLTAQWLLAEDLPCVRLCLRAADMKVIKVHKVHASRSSILVGTGGEGSGLNMGTSQYDKGCEGNEE